MEECCERLFLLFLSQIGNGLKSLESSKPPLRRGIRWTFHLRRGTFGVRALTLEFRTFDLRPLAFGPSTFNLRFSNPRPSTFDIWVPTFSTLDLRTCDWTFGPSTFGPSTATLDLRIFKLRLAVESDSHRIGIESE